MELIQLIDKDKTRLADGCILPNGQVAIAWSGEHKTHGTHPSLEAFKAIQSKIAGRAIEPYSFSYTEFYFGIDSCSFKLVRDEDVTQVSGTGVVAVGCSFFGNYCVLQWLGENGSTFWYPNFDTVEKLHGHGGKTRIVVDKYCSSSPDSSEKEKSHTVGKLLNWLETAPTWAGDDAEECLEYVNRVRG